MIPEYPFWRAPGPERAFGASADRYLDISKDEARAMLRELREEEKMADMLFAQGHLGEDQYGMNGREYAIDASPEEVRETMGALLKSFGPSHEVKIATVALALHRWFPKSAPTSPEGQSS